MSGRQSGAVNPSGAPWRDRALTEMTEPAESNLSHQVAERIIGEILTGELTFGERLPSERELATRLKVGRPTLRDAISSLGVLGFLKVRPGQGTFVVDGHAEFVGKAFGWSLLLDPGSTRDIIETRLAIETEACMLAADRADSSDVEKLDAILRRMSMSVGDKQAFAAADLDFHLSIVRAARNLALQRMLEATQELLNQWMSLAIAVPGVPARATSQHRSILRAIKTGDRAKAERAIRTHVQDMGNVMLGRVADMTMRLS